MTGISLYKQARKYSIINIINSKDFIIILVI